MCLVACKVILHHDMNSDCDIEIGFVVPPPNQTYNQTSTSESLSNILLKIGFIPIHLCTISLVISFLLSNKLPVPSELPCYLGLKTCFCIFNLSSACSSLDQYQLVSHIQNKLPILKIIEYLYAIQTSS